MIPNQISSSLISREFPLGLPISRATGNGSPTLLTRRECFGEAGSTAASDCNSHFRPWAPSVFQPGRPTANLLLMAELILAQRREVSGRKSGFWTWTQSNPELYRGQRVCLVRDGHPMDA